MTTSARKLVVGEESLLDAFLASTPETTIFLRSNLARAGLVDDGRAFSGTYAGVFEGDRLVGAAVCAWNDNVVFAPGPHAELAATTAVTLSKRNVAGILGPHDELLRVRTALGLTDRAARMTSKEILYVLALADLVLPTALAGGELVVRAPRDEELLPLLEWRMEYMTETAALPDTPDARTAEVARLAGYQESHHHFVATLGAAPDAACVAYSAFNATIADVVQIGGVWTPPALRGHGYARAAVGGSLQHARNHGVTRAVLFTPEQNLAAQKAYVSLGFRPIGHYGIVFFA